MITLAIALGGALGSVARYWLSFLALPVSATLPLGTILINVAGSFAIGLFGALTVSHGRYPVSETARLFFMAGLCGGFTTFSSFSLQTLDLLRGGAPLRAAINVAASVSFCLLAVAAGHALGTHWSGAPATVALLTHAEDDAV
jgi:CrcB protein